jgi:RNA polymerase sigma-70 factor (ECF subfamily)
MQVQAGDADSFKELFDRYWDLLSKLAAKKTGDTDNAEDMVQELFIDIWNRKKAILLTTSLRTYLVSCLYLKIFKYFRQKGFQQKHQDDFYKFIQTGDATTPVDTKEFEDEYGNLQEIIAQTVALMPNQMKTVFSLKHYKGYTTAEIAGQLDISPESVKTHLKHAMSRLRKAGSEYPSSAILLPLFLQMLDSSY